MKLLHKRIAQLQAEEPASTQRQLKQPEWQGKAEATRSQQDLTNKLKVLLLTFDTLHDLGPEPLRSGKSPGQVKDLVTEEHLHFNDELPTSKRTELH